MIGLIVDGEGDFSAFRCRYLKDKVKVLKTDGPRGHTVSERALLLSAKKQISILRFFKCKKIAIITDFESRAGCASDFCDRLAKEANKVDFAKEILFFSPDKMLENWFLADIEELSSKKKYLKDSIRQRSFESSDGKEELKKYFKSGFAYNEVRHGAELFPLVRSSHAVKNSLSFSKFFEELETFLV